MEPQTQTVTAKTGKGGLFAGLLAAMAAIATPVYVGWEGTKNTPYKDIVGVWTVCSGDTRNVLPGKKLTDAECNERTRKIVEEYGEDVSKSSPGIEVSPYEWAAHTVFAANVGIGAYSKSSIRRNYNMGNYVEACRTMRLYDKAGGKVVLGLQNRRNGSGSRIGEYELCLAGAVPKELAKNATKTS